MISGGDLDVRTYAALARVAAQHANARVALDTSAPIVSKQDGSELAVTVTFDPVSGEFVAATVQGGDGRQVFFGASLTLACAAANQALDELAPLPTPERVGKPSRYERTRPAYQQDVHFRHALSRLGELVDESQDFKS